MEIPSAQKRPNNRYRSIWVKPERRISLVISTFFENVAEYLNVVEEVAIHDFYLSLSILLNRYGTFTKKRAIYFRQFAS